METILITAFIVPTSPWFYRKQIILGKLSFLDLATTKQEQTNFNYSFAEAVEITKISSSPGRVESAVFPDHQFY